VSEEVAYTFTSLLVVSRPRRCNIPHSSARVSLIFLISLARCRDHTRSSRPPLASILFPSRLCFAAPSPTLPTSPSALLSHFRLFVCSYFLHCKPFFRSSNYAKEEGEREREREKKATRACMRGSQSSKYGLRSRARAKVYDRSLAGRKADSNPKRKRREKKEKRKVRDATTKRGGRCYSKTTWEWEDEKARGDIDMK